MVMRIFSSGEKWDFEYEKEMKINSFLAHYYSNRVLQVFWRFIISCNVFHAMNNEDLLIFCDLLFKFWNYFFCEIWVLKLHAIIYFRFKNMKKIVKNVLFHEEKINFISFL